MTRFTPDLFAGSAAELTAIRRDIHRHPETAFEEQRTAQIATSSTAGLARRSPIHSARRGAAVR